MTLVFERGVFLSHKGLNKEIIIKAAADLIETQGRECFSMRLLADSLQVKTASLYNHIKSMDELITAVCEYGLQLQKEMEMDAVKEQHGEQAVRILADTYRLFAKEHRQLYWLIMNTAAKDHQVLDNAGAFYGEFPVLCLLLFGLTGVLRVFVKTGSAVFFRPGKCFFIFFFFIFFF